MTVLILNRRPILDRIPGWLADLAEPAVLLTAASAGPDRLAGPARDWYREIVTVPDYDHPGVADLALDLARRYRVRRILGSTEVDVLRAALLRDRLDLPGQRPDSALAYRDKYRMKSLLAAAGVPVAGMALVPDAPGLRQFAAAGYPVVVKPPAGGGSLGVRVLDDPAALERFVGGLPADRYPLLAERWVAGDMYFVDGVMAAGRVTQCWASRKRYPELAVVRDSVPLLTWMLRPDDPLAARLCDMVRAVVRALPGPAEPTALHAELFHTPAGAVVLCEIACRPGGAANVPMYERALGVNLFAASLRGQAGLPVPEPAADPALVGYGLFPPRAGRLRAVPERCPLPGTERYTTSGTAGQVYRAPRSISDVLAQVLVVGTGTEDLTGRMTELARWWAAACRWDPPDGATVPAGRRAAVGHGGPDS